MEIVELMLTYAVVFMLGLAIGWQWGAYEISKARKK